MNKQIQEQAQNRNSNRLSEYTARLVSSVHSAPKLDSEHFDELLTLPSPIKEQEVVSYLLGLARNDGLCVASGQASNRARASKSENLGY